MQEPSTSTKSEEAKNINGQNYVKITEDQGRKLMQRITTPDDFQKNEESPDFVLIDSSNTPRRRSLSSVKGHFNDFSTALIQTGKQEIRKLSFYQALGSEFIGTFLLTLIVCGLGVKLDPTSNSPRLAGALGGGLTLATLIWFANCISGGHFNPAITIAVVCTSNMHAIKGFAYIIFQLLGAISGAASLVALLPQDFRSGVGLTLINDNISLLTAFGVEFIITFVLTLTVFACIDNTRKDLGGSVPLTVGTAVTIGALFGGQFTGGSMNPARSFGPALIHNVWTHHWIYWLGPIIGALIAAICYNFVLKPKATKTA